MSVGRTCLDVRRIAWMPVLWCVASGCRNETSAATFVESTGDADDSSGGTSPASTSESSSDPSGPMSLSSTTVDPDSSTSDASSTGESTDPSGPTTADTMGESSTGAGPIALECPIDALGPALPSALFGNTFPQLDGFASSCGGSGSPDAGYTFTAPEAGTYTFDTQGSQLDTVLSLLDAECGGNEIACNDDGDGPQSALAVALEAAQTVTVVVDGNAANGLPFNLRVQQGSLVCPVGDLGDVVPTTMNGNTSVGFDGDGGSCGGGTGREIAYLFTAPTTATYTFDTFGAAFESRLYVRDGVCGGDELACGVEGLLVELAQGQQVTVVVDGNGVGGAFTLHVDTQGGACPDLDLGMMTPQSVVDTTIGKDNTETSSCGGAFSPDDLYRFTSGQAGVYQFDTIGSSFDTVLYLHEGCDGDERACNDDLDGGSTDSRIVERMGLGEDVIVGVDGNGMGAYELHVARLPCPETPLAGPLPLSIDGTTLGALDKVDGSCGGGADDSPDATYSFTAPADGVYTFDTLEAAFDSRIYLLEGASCLGAELGCGDAYQFDQGAAFSVPLVGGQMVTVVVDGNDGSSGAFTLGIGALAGVCPDGDLGNTVPASIEGSTVGGDNASTGSCGGLVGNDASYTFTAPVDALYEFDSTGSAIDTVVYVRDAACDGTELDCDWVAFGGQATAYAALTAGQTVVVTLDSDGPAGDFVLTVDEAPPGGPCCEVQDDEGCGVAEIESCVCYDVGDTYCCDILWDEICVGEAIDDCGAQCV